MTRNRIKDNLLRMWMTASPAKSNNWVLEPFTTKKTNVEQARQEVISSRPRDSVHYFLKAAITKKTNQGQSNASRARQLCFGFLHLLPSRKQKKAGTDTGKWLKGYVVVLISFPDEHPPKTKWSTVHTTARLHNDYNRWCKTTQLCSAWLTVIIFMPCHSPGMTDSMTERGHKPDIMHFSCTC